MEEYLTLQEIDQAAEYIKKRISIQPQIGLILGSGLGDLAESIENPVIIPYSDIPFWPVSTVEGHAGQLVIGKIGNIPILVMKGRIHFYEGYSVREITLPVRVMQRLGIGTLILTNASGAVDPDLEPGDIMMLTDHLTLMAMAGVNPLIGPNYDSIGERFVDMGQVYDRELISIARDVARDESVDLHEGIYICLAGPSYETPADTRFLRVMGADAVGMSTVPEAIAARHGSMRVLGFSGVSARANLDGNTVTTHEEVLEAGKMIVPGLKKILFGVLKKLHTE